MCELLVGLPEVVVLGVEDGEGAPLVVHVESRRDQARCPRCGTRGRLKDRSAVELVDLAAFGRPARLIWHKQRWCCPSPSCEVGSWTVIDDAIAPKRARLTDRAARWATREVGKAGRPVAEVARELDCDWHTVMDAVNAYGEALLARDGTRTARVEALGLDETLFVRRGERHRKHWATSIVDVGAKGHVTKLVEVVEGRTAKAASTWIDAQPEHWRAAIRWGTLDMSGPYRKAFNDSLGNVTQVADPFHVLKHANSKLDECRRRVQNDTLGHRGRKDDPL
jgi:transposase